jgi:hypothetical protein
VFHLDILLGVLFRLLYIRVSRTTGRIACALWISALYAAFLSHCGFTGFRAHLACCLGCFTTYTV